MARSGKITGIHTVPIGSLTAAAVSADEGDNVRFTSAQAPNHRHQAQEGDGLRRAGERLLWDHVGTNVFRDALLETWRAVVDGRVAALDAPGQLLPRPIEPHHPDTEGGQTIFEGLH